ncbi:polyprenyl synthetase family protein [Kibdelosporangium persicum]|uniref:Multifunctional geranylgeranyl pyrophosphate synthetase: dimethylallyltransferase + geranyltranstransferase + farnesyltranstransferase n=1 Tax=Kibdelosporangium persicum TaxID=2698649 RepID=A0ABX2F8Z8_9PSEU|nr:polyprenyl synthetase family protein [Kibdelosporangium persicum]NRN67668.1 Multifunctional geranylgeranyl pyrophosphate synthetase: dimethylallyltransferase + geranyltranstransferase + farnesyltranstransferase [Kibdelosporangium persicum]
MTLPSTLDTAVTTVSPALRAAVDKYLCPEIAAVARYHHGWTDASGRPAEARGGKLLRPALALLSAQAAGATAADGVAAGVAIEFVHNFSLLHDDIMDGDRTRRGRATAWTLFGVPQAILAGDALLTAATTVLLDSRAAGAAPAAKSLMAATQRMISGQASDVRFERRGDVTLPECVRMARNKTGALLACACSLGASLVGAPADLVQRLNDFGEHIGLAFQLIDDLLGIWGDPARTGKQAGADLRARKNSLPVVAALTAPGSAELRSLYLRPDPLTEGEVHHVAGLVERLGGRDWAQDEAARQIAAAEKNLGAAAIPDDVRDELRELAGFVTGRRF